MNGTGGANLDSFEAGIDFLFYTFFVRVGKWERVNL